MEIDCVLLCENLASDLDRIIYEYQAGLSLIQQHHSVMENSGQEISTKKISCQNETERVVIGDYLDQMARFIELEQEKLRTEDTSAQDILEQKESELVHGVYNQIKACSSSYSIFYQQIQDRFDSQKFISSLNPYLGLCLFFLKLIDSFKVNISYLYAFLHRVVRYVDNLLFASIARNCISQDDDQASFRVFGYLSYLIHNYNSTNWNYWFGPAPTTCKRLTSDSTTLLKQALQHQDIKRYYQTIFPDFDEAWYKIATDSAILRTRIVYELPEGECHGFTTSNLYIFIRKMRSNSPSVVFCGTFIILLHELGDYLCRCKCRTIGEILQVKTANNANLNTSEGREYIEKMLFGGKVSFVSEEGADYLYSNVSSFSIGHFKDMIKVGELETEEEFKLARRGIVLKRVKGVKHSCILGIGPELELD